MAAYGLFGSIAATPGQGAALEAHLVEAGASMQDVRGCQLYVISRDTSNPDTVCVFEVWDSTEAHTASLQLESVQALIARARPIIAGMGDRYELDVVGGKGLG